MGLTFVCPNCLRKLRFGRKEATEETKLCPICRVPLLGENGPRTEFQCLRCRRRIITPEGVWCTHYEEVPMPDGMPCDAFEARIRSRRARRSK
jgi:hypothetical protein